MPARKSTIYKPLRIELGMNEADAPGEPRPEIAEELTQGQLPDELKQADAADVLKQVDAPGEQRSIAEERDFNELSREEIIELLKKVARELGHRPNQYEFWQKAGAKKEHMRRLFGSYRELVQEAGFEALGPGFYRTIDELLENWAVVARKLGKAPSVEQYNKVGKYSHRAFRCRWKSWQDVPGAVVEWASAKWPDRQWDDVVEIARKYMEQRRAPGKKSGAKKYQLLTSGHDGLTTTDGGSTSTQDEGLTSTAKKEAAALYGRPMVLQAMANAPVNEMGVMFLFASMAKELGFSVLRVQAGFPDCEALRKGDDGRWRRVRIEFEFESRNFLVHGHDVKGCELIVCWVDNWASCPVDVLELSKMV